MQKRRDADAFLLCAVWVIRGKLLDLGVIIGEFECAFQHLIEHDRVMDHLIGRRRHSLVQQVAPAELVGSHADGLRHMIHVPLHRKQALRSAEAAEGTVRRRVRGVRLGVDANARPEVGAACMDGAARQHRGGQGGVGAPIGDELDLGGEQFTVCADRGAVPGARRMPLA